VAINKLYHSPASYVFKDSIKKKRTYGDLYFFFLHEGHMEIRFITQEINPVIGYLITPIPAGQTFMYPRPLTYEA
jgi:hypothetical protein